MNALHASRTINRRLIGLGLILAGAVVLASRQWTPSAAQLAARTSLRFEANQGQFAPSVRFLARGPGYGLSLTNEGATLALRRATGEQSVVSMRLVGARPVEPTGLRPLASRTNYFIGNDQSRWRSEVPTYGAVRYSEVSPGVDLVYYDSGDRQIEYDVVLAPGIDPASVSLAFEGPTRLAIDRDGSAVLGLPQGLALRKAPPRAYQQDAAGARVAVAARYDLHSDGTLGFTVGPHDLNRPLVIDPVLLFSTFLGGSNSDGAEAVAVDSSGYVYVAGYTLSGNFPTVGPGQPANAGSYDVFVSKLSPGGAFLVYSTYLGGSGEDRALGLAVDSSGSPYLTGYTLSTNFPTVGPLQPAAAGQSDVFVAKLNPAGSSLFYSTYLGGSSTDAAYGIAVDGVGAAYVAGYTFSAGFPTVGAPHPALAGVTDAFVSKLSPAGSALVYSTLLGGNSDEVANAVAVDSAGNAYLAGWTASTNFPTVMPLQPALAGSSDAFVARLNNQGTALTYATYLGGAGADVAKSIAVDASNSAYVGGYTTSDDFPTVGAAQGALAGGYDGFVAKLAPSGAALAYSTYLGGSFLDRVNAIAVGPDGSASVAGYTESLDFPRGTPVQANHGGGVGDAFASTLTASGGTLAQSTFLGGNSEDNARAIAVDSNSVYVAGLTRSGNFPTYKPLQGLLAGGPYDAFVLRLGAPIPPVPATTVPMRLALVTLLLGAALLFWPRRSGA